MTAIRIQVRRGLAAQWVSVNPVLSEGEIGFETDTGKFKIGDGLTAWNALAYPPAGVSDHGALTGLADDDHPQYYNAARGAVAFDALGAADAAEADAIAAAAADATTKANAAQAAAIAASQPLDSDLTAIAGLAPSNDDVVQRKAGAWTNRTMAQLAADLSLSGTNTGDQTSIVGITGTLAEFNTAITDGNIGTGDVVGPAVAVDNEPARFDGTTGKLIQGGSGVTISDAGALDLPAGTITDPAITFAGDSAGWFRNAADQWTFTPNGTVNRFTLLTTAFRGASNALLSWSATADSTNGADTGLGRNAAGVVEINSGTAGTLRDLTLRTLTTVGGNVHVPQGFLVTYRNGSNGGAHMGAGGFVCGSTVNLGYRWTSGTNASPVDTGLLRAAAGIVEVTNGTTATYRDLIARNLITSPVTVANLTAAATAGAGARSFVTDSNQTMAAGIGTNVVGGGTDSVPVYCDGTNWLIG